MCPPYRVALRYPIEKGEKVEKREMIEVMDKRFKIEMTRRLNVQGTRLLRYTRNDEG